MKTLQTVLIIVVLGIGQVTSGHAIQEFKVTASDEAVKDYFGISVAIDEDTAIVGAPHNDSAYIFVRSGGIWTQQAKLIPSDMGDYFGYSVAISGEYAIVGDDLDDDAGTDSGSAYIFVRSGVSWTQQAKLTASDAAAGDGFGYSVAISGEYAIVGVPGDDHAGIYSGSAYIFALSGGSWIQQAKLTASDATAGDVFGDSVAISGEYAIVGTPQDDDAGIDSGSAYIFARSGGVWTQQAKLTASDAAAGDAFGFSVGISEECAIAGAYGDGHAGIESGSAYIFVRSGGVWTQRAKLIAGDAAAYDYFGYSVGISREYAIAGAYGDDNAGESSGSAYIYESGWVFPTGDHVRSSPAVGPDGTIYVGSNDRNLYAINPDGTEKWRFGTGGWVCSSPAIDSGGTIYVGSNDGNLYAIDPDGIEKWRFGTGDCVSSSPAIGSDGTVYVGSQDHNLYAVDADGNQKWAFNIGSSVYSSPAIGDDNTIYVCNGDLYAIKPDGTQKWVVPTVGGTSSSPAIGFDGTIYVGAYDDFHAFYPDGTWKWSFQRPSAGFSSPVTGSDGTIYVGVLLDGNLYAINPDDGTEKWRFNTQGEIDSAPAVGCDGTIYVGSGDGNLYAIAPDGTEKWRFSTWDGVCSSPVIDCDGAIYVGSDDNNLYAIGVTWIGLNGGGSGGLADSSWPMFHHDMRHTGRISDVGELCIEAFCLVDLIVTDSQGRAISKDASTIPLAIYIQTDLDGDGDLDDVVTIPAPVVGKYSIQVVPEPNAQPTDTYALQASYKGTSIKLAENVQIQDIPSCGYAIEYADDTIIKLDIMPPTITCSLSPTSNPSKQSKGNQSKVDNQSGFFLVKYSAEDDQTPDPLTTGTIHGFGVTDGEIIKYTQAPGRDTPKLILIGSGKIKHIIFSEDPTLVVTSIDAAGNTATEECSAETPPGVASKVIEQSFTLGQSYPNPCNPGTWIPYVLPKDTDVIIRIYSASGHLIRTLDLGHQAAGTYTRRGKAAYWDGRNESGELIASGIYFYTLRAGDFQATRRMIIMR